MPGAPTEEATEPAGTVAEGAPSAGVPAAARAGRSSLRAVLVALRPQEWIKNVLVLAGLVFSGRFDELAAVSDAALAFVAFCAISSAGYLFNDIRDAPFDRRHPDKRLRPIASGELSPAAAGTIAIALAAFSLALALALVGGKVALTVASYGAISAAYTLGLKRLVIVDVMTIAALFILRVVAGAVAVGAQASEWLLLCTAMLALFLGFTKRRQEATAELDAGTATRPVLEHYSLPFLDQMVAMVTASAIISYAIYAVNSPLIGSRMLATAPPVLYGIFRYLYLVYDRKDTRSTARILTEDPGMVLAGAAWVGTALLMLYVFD
jgi:4-hydroxybenzoate polyprenyltransferase